MSAVKFKWFLLAGVVALCCAWNTNTFANPNTGVLSTKSERGVKVAQAPIDACAKLSVGDTCSFTSRKGKTLTGTCVAGKGQNASLACRPEHAPFKPPQAAVDACANHAAGDACSFTSHRGKTLAGNCEAGRGQNASLICKPSGWHFGHQK